MDRGGRKQIIAIVVIFIFTLVLAACGGNATTEEPKQPTATYIRDTPVPAVVDDAIFKEYFSEFGLGQLPAGAKVPAGIEKDKTEFSTGQDLCFYSVNIKQTKISYEIFDENTKNSVSPKTIYLNPLIVGNNGDCVNIDVGSGNFEFRVYVKSVVVKIIKFTVK